MQAANRNRAITMGAYLLRRSCKAGVAALMLAGAANLVNGASHANPIMASEQSITRGRSIYMHHCAECHGRAGRGDGSAGRDLDPHPTDLTRPDLANLSDLQLFRKISRGRKPMPSFDRLLKEEDRWHVVNFVRTFHKPQAGASAR